MKRIQLIILFAIVLGLQAIKANESIGLTFNRTGIDASSVTIAIADMSGNVIEGATATLSSTHNFKPNGGNGVTSAILCPDINGNTSPQIEIAVSINGVLHEDKNIASQYPEVVKEMKQILLREHTESSIFKVTLPSAN